MHSGSNRSSVKTPCLQIIVARQPSSVSLKLENHSQQARTADLDCNNNPRTPELLIWDLPCERAAPNSQGRGPKCPRSATRRPISWAVAVPSH